MYRDIKQGNRGMWISLCCSFLILGLSACNSPGTGTDDPMPTLTGGESQDVELGQQEQALKKIECPSEDTLYELIYDHHVILRSGDEGAGSFHFEWEEEEPAVFHFWMGSNGKTEKKMLLNLATINVSGWAETGSDECPVQELQGAWLLSADITGSCKKGVVTLKVVEQYENHELTGSCGDPITAPGPTSAPELTLTFNLSEPGSTDGIMSGTEGDPFYAFYWYQLSPYDQ